MEWNFKEGIPIYTQIIDEMTMRIASSAYEPGEKLPSVRDLALDAGVNPNTMARSYETLTADGIIYNKRGIGFFVSAAAPQKVLDNARRSFYDNELPQFLKRMTLLNISFEEITKQ